MPDSRHNAPFVISDHWIRVHPEQNVAVPTHSPAWASKVVPKHLFVRLMVFDDAAKASAVEEQLASGGSFFELARANSTDRASAMNGGYLGDLDASALDPEWAKAALALRPGGVSKVITGPGRYFIAGRMPRNFREEAEVRFNHAMELRKEGNRQQTAAELVEALKIDPRLLRALTYLGVTYAEGGNPQVGAGVLGAAIRLYPQDAGAHFNLGVADGAMRKNDEIDEYKKALAIDPDYVPAYLNWGGALFLKGQYDEAIKVYREGINVDPLEASLHYSLSLALERENKSQEAQAEKALAEKIDPKTGTQ
jgi:tetratricopeptide (TPR) repeat protein